MTYSEPSLEPTNTNEEQADNSESNQAKKDSMQEYYQLKETLLWVTLLITGISFALVWTFYSLNIALNYFLGASFGLVYLNMLAGEVERVGHRKRRIGATRLALFVGLMVVASQLQQLKIIPIFFGFMTYKAAILFYILPSSLLKVEMKEDKGSF